MESAMRRALERDKLLLYFQPQIDLRSRGLAGFEALVRWNHPEMGMVLPGKCMPIAEETGLIVPIGDWVLRQACIEWRRWPDAGLTPMQMSVNLSIRQFQRRDNVDTVSGIIKETAMDPVFLQVELTESVFMTNVQSSSEISNGLKMLGVQLAIDDFGNGFSSLNYLKRLPIDTLKIDRSFVRDIGSDPNDAAIVQAIIALARALHIEVVAEGVETEAQCEFLKLSSCFVAQGILASRPLTHQDATEWLRRGSDAIPTLSSAE